jgi:hypothetical protein
VPYFILGARYEKARKEFLSTHWFMGLEDTAEKLETWRRDYNFASLRPSFYVVEGNRFC